MVLLVSLTLSVRVGGRRCDPRDWVVARATTQDRSSAASRPGSWSAPRMGSAHTPLSGSQYPVPSSPTCCRAGRAVTAMPQALSGRVRGRLTRALAELAVTNRAHRHDRGPGPHPAGRADPRWRGPAGQPARCRRPPDPQRALGKPVEFGSKAFRAACQRTDIAQSMGKPGSALDNAVIEAWHSTLEFELRPRPRR